MLFARQLLDEIVARRSAQLSPFEEQVSLALQVGP
jgi:hypothetical protein